MKFLSFVSRGSICLLIGFLSLTSLTGVTTGYIKLGDIKGESTEVGHEEEIEVSNIAWGINRSISAGTQRTGGGVILGDIIVTKNVDKATPKLFEACSDGILFPEAVLAFQRDTGGGRVDYLKITMTDVIVTSVSMGGSGGEDGLTETVSLNFTEAEILYTIYQSDGSPVGNVPGTVRQSVATP